MSKIVLKFVLATGLMLAAAFIFSCSSDGGSGNGSRWSGGDNGGDNGSGSEGGSSSSSAPSSSSVEPNPPLTKQTITLSYAGTSYADLDLIQTYKQAAITTIKNKIDIVAYNGQVNENVVYSPSEVDIFYDNGVYYGSRVFYYPLPSATVNLITNATKASDILDFTDALGSFINTTSSVTKISIALNTGFLVSTSDGNFVAAVITGTGTQSVTLSITKFP